MTLGVGGHSVRIAYSTVLIVAVLFALAPTVKEQ